MNDLTALIHWHTTRAAVAARLDAFPRSVPVAPAWVSAHRPTLNLPPAVRAS